jgi:anaerobic selenocysteine-containing dehydrogenase
MIDTLLRRFDGPLTRELVRSPGQFGLGQVPDRLTPNGTTTSVCGYCSTGCGLKVHLRDGEAVNLSADPRYPVNLGMACPKGWEALAPLNAQDRAVTPLIRNAQGTLQPAGWNETLEAFATRFKAIMQKHGPESVAFLSTGQIPTEEMLTLGMLWKFGMGALHGDANTRQCMATSHVAYKQSFGFDAPPFTYKDFEESDVLVFIGANPAIAHPIMWERVMLNKRNPETWIIDPRRTETAAAATHHVGLAPKSDLTLLYGLAHILLRDGQIDRAFIDAHTEGFDDFIKNVMVEDFTPERVARAANIEVEQLEALAKAIRPGKRVSFWWTMGVNQSHEAVRTAQAIIALCLMGGHIGKPGTGPNSITGQANAMGSRLYSNTTSMVGGRDFLNAEHRQQVADILGIDVGRIPQKNTLAYDQILDGIREGKIKGLWVVATNPRHSWIGQGDLDAVLGRLDCLVVQDMYVSTDTARLAHIVLPAAGWGEKEGTFINSERRIGVHKKIRRAPGQALADFHIFRLVAQAWGCGELFAEIRNPEDAFKLMQRFSAGRPCDITGIQGYDHVDAMGGIQWPLPEGHQAEALDRERRLFADGRFHTPSGKAKFLFDAPRAPGETPSAQYPLILLTGRGTSAQWHTGTRTAKSAVLRKLYPADCYVELHPEDAASLKVAHQDWVMVSSKRGETKARACITTAVQKGQVFLPMHYDQVNALTFPEFDPYSRQPSYKYCAVAVKRV